MIDVYAVVCSSQEVHVDDEHSYLFLDEHQALDIVEAADEEPCGPHQVFHLIPNTVVTP